MIEYYTENLAGELEKVDPKDISDGYHTFAELYEYRLLYNAALFNEWAMETASRWLTVHDVHKSKKHSDGEDCFNGKFFIVVAQLPTGQISNHYKLEHWDLFKIPEKEMAAEYDGHSPTVAAQRLREYIKSNPDYRISEKLKKND